MPFTFSHPAIVLPVAYLPRHWFSLTGLIIGSLTPDFAYFLRMKIQGFYGHTIGGLFGFDLPLGLLLAFVFHNIVRDSLIANLPFFLKARFSAFRSFDWNAYFKRHWFVVVASVLIGAASHLFWDGFTHGNGYFVGKIPALSGNVNLWAKQVPVCEMLQHLSTLIGGLIIAFAIYKLPVDQQETRGVKARYWVTVAGLAMVIIAARFLGGLELRQIGDVIVTVISAGLISLTVTPLLDRI